MVKYKFMKHHVKYSFICANDMRVVKNSIQTATMNAQMRKIDKKKMDAVLSLVFVYCPDVHRK